MKTFSPPGVLAHAVIQLTAPKAVIIIELGILITIWMLCLILDP
jgi:hypothetical protein